MKKLSLFLIVCFALINISLAQSSVWKVEGKGNILYIGGTVHILRAQEKESTKLNLPLTKLAKMKPSMVISMFIMFKMLELGFTTTGVDKHFHLKAKKDKKGLLFFETIDDQIKVLTTMGDGNEDEYVLYYLNDFEKTEKMFLDIINSWRKGTVKVMSEQIKEMKSDYNESYKSILVDRNNNWFPKIDKFLDDTAVEYILVGALHLYGPDGVLKMLKDKGYSVEQFKI